MPRLLAILPAELWSLLMGCLIFAVGFGVISLTSTEAPTSRLFRWVIIAVFTILIALFQPVMHAFKNLPGGPDALIWDEVLFVALALSVLVYGILQFRRHPQAHVHAAPPKPQV